ncbi:uncharacterized protein LOC122265279 [Penaeus japonicus]|uniref:uncharacterized protein LOC122265279 n=1 Tax=Penaeus japonicus TaxID=27405 RepID=UPI001C70EF03|nr:uncharacterized protein LOC122265279 [Penaeus japonicus]
MTPTRSSRTDQSQNRPTHVIDQRTLNFQNKIHIATWNVQTLLRPGYATLLSHKLNRYNISLAGLCETRWPGNGETIAGDHCYIWSGLDDGRGLNGVAMAMPKSLRQSLISWNPISGRLFSARFLHQHRKIPVIVACGPTEISEETDKDLFSDNLRNLIQDVPPHDITIVLTDFNATISAEACDPQQPITRHIFIDTFTKDNGNRLLNLCRFTNLCISDTWFPCKHGAVLTGRPEKPMTIF